MQRGKQASETRRHQGEEIKCYPTQASNETGGARQEGITKKTTSSVTTWANEQVDRRSKKRRNHGEEEEEEEEEIKCLTLVSKQTDQVRQEGVKKKTSVLTQPSK